MAEEEIKRILRLPEKADPFAILGLAVFSDVVEEASTTEGEATNGAAPTSSSSSSAINNKTRAPKWKRNEIELNDVKKAYRKLVVVLHPDKCKLAGAEDAFMRADKAYKTLSSSEAIVERFLIQLERARKREDDLRQRAQEAEAEQRRRKGATGNGTGSAAAAAASDMFAHMSREERAAAVYAEDRKEKLAALARKADQMTRDQAQHQHRSNGGGGSGATTSGSNVDSKAESVAQASAWSDLMDGIL